MRSKKEINDIHNREFKKLKDMIKTEMLKDKYNYSCYEIAQINDIYMMYCNLFDTEIYNIDDNEFTLERIIQRVENDIIKEV